MDFSEEIPGFIIESTENLAQVDLELVQLEKSPGDEALISSVFRSIHTIKGTSGFFGFSLLGGIAHGAENLLGQVREKQRSLTPELVSLILQTVDAVREILSRIEASGQEGPDQYQGLREGLERAFGTLEAPAQPAPPCQPAASCQPAPAQPTPAPVMAAAQVEPAAAPPSPARLEADEAPMNRRAEDRGLSSSTIRVDVSLLDKLMNLVGELVLARNQILQGGGHPPAANATSQRLNLITSELQECVMRTRMQPISGVWNRLPRVVRDLAAELGKSIELTMEGADTELDRTIIEAIKDPLTHIVRNSCDHGIEAPDRRLLKGKPATGTIRLRAFHEGGHVNIEIADDGAGVNLARVKNKALQNGLITLEQATAMNEWETLRLIFMPGFSTAERITGVSGRGVGMDVVKTNIEKISGTVDITNIRSGGSMIKIKIPLTLAIIPGLIVSLAGAGSAGASGDAPALRFVIPQANLLELVRLEGERGRAQIEMIHGVEVYRRRGGLLPLAYLSELLGLAPRAHEQAIKNIIVVKAEDTAFGLVVEQVHDTQEIVVKALGKQLASLSCYVGATVMGDGKIALILDVPGVARLAKLLAPPLERARAALAADTRAGQPCQLLLFRAGRYARLVLDLSLVARLEEIAANRVEYAGGLPVVRYRDTILPLRSLSHLLDPDTGTLALEAHPLQVIVFREGGRSIGLVVDQIVDIVEETVAVKHASSVAGLLGSGVVGGKVADFLDLEAVLAAANLAGGTEPSSKREQAILLVDPSQLARVSLRNFLEMHGYPVFDVADRGAAWKALEHGRFGVIVLAAEAAGHAREYPRGAALITLTDDHLTDDHLTDDNLRNNSLTSGSLIGSGPETPPPAGWKASIPRHDREALLRAIASLSIRQSEPQPVAELELAGGAR